MKILTAKTLETRDRTIRQGEHVIMATCLTKGWRDKKVFTVNLDGANASFTWFIYVLGSDMQEFPFDLHINHRACTTKSRVYARAVLDESAAVRFHGISSIGPHAKGADTYCSFHTLLLSPDARATTIPSLEICTQDVRAGHAASVDRFLPHDLFYLQTRGLEEEAARTLLTRSFLTADMHYLSDESARAALTEKIAAWSESRS
ncbi:SufD family Fe-S cluster assembly protein [Candidatus Uhrbacteria bacterium]|nr:SufD family Fe-S cluster assembly protein [Candidatus Uhrbacteria bacterium]